MYPLRCLPALTAEQEERALPIRSQACNFADCSWLMYFLRFHAHLVPLKGLLGLERVLSLWRRGLSYWLEKGPMVEKGPKSWVTSAREKAGLWLPISPALSFRFRDLVEALIKPSRWWWAFIFRFWSLMWVYLKLRKTSPRSPGIRNVCVKDLHEGSDTKPAHVPVTSHWEDLIWGMRGKAPKLQY